MSNDTATGSDSKSLNEIRHAFVMVWMVILILILKTPSKTLLDYFLLFLAIASMSSFLGTAFSKRLVNSESLPPLSERCKAVARDPARKIEAIKMYREETGLGLREAKIAVEAFIANGAL